MSAPGTTPKLFIGLADHFGLKGEKYTRQLRFLARHERPIESKAARFRYWFVDAAGYRFTWDTDVDKFADGGLLAIGDDVEITFRVDGHSRKGQAATRIKNCRLKI